MIVRRMIDNASIERLMDIGKVRPTDRPTVKTALRNLHEHWAQFERDHEHAGTFWKLVQQTDDLMATLRTCDREAIHLMEEFLRLPGEDHLDKFFAKEFDAAPNIYAIFRAIIMLGSAASCRAMSSNQKPKHIKTIIPGMPSETRRRRHGGSLESRRLKAFIGELLKAVRAGGGDLTVQKNIDAGSLRDALEILRPHLPRVIPKKISASTLQRIKKRNPRG